VSKTRNQLYECGPRSFEGTGKNPLYGAMDTRSQRESSPSGVLARRKRMYASGNGLIKPFCSTVSDYPFSNARNR